MNRDCTVLEEEEVFEHPGLKKPKGIETGSRRTSWKELCEISRVLTNEFHYPPKEDGLVWMNDNGKDGPTRFASKDGKPAKFVNFAQGKWEGAGYYQYAGFEEKAVDTLVWVSSGSGSMLEAKKGPFGWTLTMFQPERSPKYQGWYQEIFKDFNNLKEEIKSSRKDVRMGGELKLVYFSTTEVKNNAMEMAFKKLLDDR